MILNSQIFIENLTKHCSRENGLPLTTVLNVSDLPSFDNSQKLELYTEI